MNKCVSYNLNMVMHIFAPPCAAHRPFDSRITVNRWSYMYNHAIMPTSCNQGLACASPSQHRFATSENGGGEIMHDFSFSELFSFTLALVGMILAYLGKRRKPKKRKHKSMKKGHPRSK